MPLPEIPRLINPAKERMKSGGVAFGLTVRLVRSDEVARIAKVTGHDFVMIDCQHSVFNLETIFSIANTALGCGVSPMVRVRSVHDRNVSVLLDNNVTGIIFPDVNSAEEAKLAVSTCKFPPVGRRSVAGVYPIFDYQPVPTARVTEILNENTLVVCMIETQEGLDNVDEIAAVDGVDVIHVGSNDLMLSLGRPGEFGSPVHMAAMERVIAAGKAHGKWVGFGGDRNVERQVKFMQDGVQFATTQSDFAYLIADASRTTAELRDRLGRPSP